MQSRASQKKEKVVHAMHLSKIYHDTVAKSFLYMIILFGIAEETSFQIKQVFRCLENEK